VDNIKRKAYLELCLSAIGGLWLILLIALGWLYDAAAIVIGFLNLNLLRM